MTTGAIFFINFLIVSAKVVKLIPSLNLTNKTIRVSLSHICPMTILSKTSLTLSTCLYISAVPILTPPGFKVASDLS